MASKRRRKHRGTQAGTVQARGRTSKPASRGGKSATRTGRSAGGRPSRARSREEVRADAQRRRAERFERQPDLRTSAKRAAIAAAIFLIVLILALGQKPLPSVNLALLMFLIYVPMGYFTDKWIYNRRQRQKARMRGGGKEAEKPSKGGGGTPS